jgi:hypothetical protein
MIKIMRVFLNTDMRLAHDGLTLLALKEGVDLQTLDRGEFIMFMNSHLTRMKLFTANGIIAYMRSPTGKPMDLRAVVAIPRAFMATGKIDYDESVKEFLKERLLLVPAA